MKHRAIYLSLPQRINEIESRYGTPLDPAWLNEYIFVLSELQQQEINFFKQGSLPLTNLVVMSTNIAGVFLVKFPKSSSALKHLKEECAAAQTKIPQSVSHFFTQTAGHLLSAVQPNAATFFEMPEFASPPVIMGIVNVTPDSFSDGGEYYAVDKAVERALEMEQNGAQIIDIGGESSRPGADPVGLQEELQRTIPVIRALRRQSAVPISIDTYKSEVARSALDAGADMVNDISALRKDPQMADVVAKADCPVIIMHMKGEPRNMQKNPYYDDVLAEIYHFFAGRIGALEAAGIHKIILDPGIGFGKRVEDNLRLIRDLKDFSYLGKPLLIGVSRKSFIGQVLNKDVNERLLGTVVANIFASIHSAAILRVHDVAEMQDVKIMLNAILAGKP